MNRWITTRIALVTVLGLLMTACGSGGSQAKKTRQPGLYGRLGYECFNSRYCTGNLSALVGIPVDWSTKANCVGGPWYRDRVEIVSGALPPGLSIDPAQNYHIVGVPRRAGTWHLRIRMLNVRCAGKTYGDFTQDLHITTKGSSAPGRVD